MSKSFQFSSNAIVVWAVHAQVAQEHATLTVEMGLAMVAQIRVIRERWATRSLEGICGGTGARAAQERSLRECNREHDSSSDDEDESCEENSAHPSPTLELNMRVGVHSGTVVAGVIGQRRFQFDVFGVDVLIANKMESYGLPGYASDWRFLQF